MGHERIGYLPRSRHWRYIVDEIGKFSNQNHDVSLVAKNTIMNVRERFEKFDKDPSVKSSFNFLVTLAFAFKQKDPVKYLTEIKALNSNDISLIQLAKAVHNSIPTRIKSDEYNTFSKQAAIDAINHWYMSNKPEGTNLFGDSLSLKDILRKTSNGNGFCELSRLYFAKFTERYLKYFLEREASSSISNYKDRERFNSEIEKHIDLISRHAFETSKITESFAAGWFNKNAKDTLPTEKQINGFLSYAFGKMKNELLREEFN